MMKQDQLHRGCRSSRGQPSGKKTAAIILMTVTAFAVCAVLGIAADDAQDPTLPLQQTVQPSSSEPAIGEQIKWQVISAGGRTGDPVKADTILGGSVGQTAAGTGIVPTCCNTDGRRGNVDGDPVDATNVADLTYLVDYLFRGGPPPPCKEEGDVNGDCTINVSDLTYLVDYLFRGGPPPPPCPPYKYRLDHGFWQRF